MIEHQLKASSIKKLSVFAPFIMTHVIVCSMHKYMAIVVSSLSLSLSLVAKYKCQTHNLFIGQGYPNKKFLGFGQSL